MPAADKSQPPTIRVAVGGQEIPDHAQVVETVVRRAASRPARLELTAKAAASRLFKPGHEIEFTVDGERLFTGTIQGVTKGGDHFVVAAEDALHRLRQKRVRAVFEEKTPQDILRTVLSEAGLDCDIPELKEPFEIEQYLVADEPALDVCMQLAADAGLLFRWERNKVVFSLLDADLPVVAMLDETGPHFNFSGEKRQVPGQVTLKSWNLESAEVLEQQAAVNAGDKGAGVVRQCACQSVEGLKFLVQGAAREVAAMSFAGSGSTAGNARIAVGTRIELKPDSKDDKGKKLPAGEYLVTACEHHVDAHEYVTRFSLGLSEPLPRPSRGPAPLLPAVVVSIEGDPQEKGRIRVKLPTLWRDDQAEVWAHAVRPHGGFHFPHDVTDQVLLSFIAGDPSLPVVLGAMPTKAMFEKFRTPATKKKGNRGAGQLTYGRSSLQLGSGDEEPAGGSLAGPKCKLEIVDPVVAAGSSPAPDAPKPSVRLHGPDKAAVELKEGHVRLEAGAGSLDLDGASLVTRVKNLETVVEALLSLKSLNKFNLNSGATMDLQSATVSINGDALKIT